MRVLTIKSPWAYLICSGQKDVENRTWKTNYRGRILIHVSQKSAKEIKNFDVLHLPGCIIGSVEIVNCVEDSKSKWAIPGMWHWILKNAKFFDNYIENIKGKLSLWTIPETISIPIS